MKRFLLPLLALVAGLPVFGAMSPNEEIEHLLKYMATLKGATFVRNGVSYSAAEAEAHLRQKWAFVGARITSADDFITFCATKSSISGRAYLIHYADGHEEPSALVLRSELLRSRAKSAIPPGR